MAHMKMSWHTEGDRVASEWVESEAKGSYNPAWMRSSYPCEASASRARLSSDFSSLSPFGRMAPFAVLTKALLTKKS